MSASTISVATMPGVHRVDGDLIPEGAGEAVARGHRQELRPRVGLERDEAGGRIQPREVAQYRRIERGGSRRAEELHATAVAQGAPTFDEVNETDPRFVRSRQAILDAARELLIAEGPTAVTPQQIAERAGIRRATVYRHWPRTEHLLAEAMTSVPLPFFDAPVAPFREWATRELTALARHLESDAVRAVATTLANAALWNPDMDLRRAGFARVLSERLAEGLAQAERHGELTLRVDPQASAALAVGPIYYRATIEHAPSDSILIERCIASLGTWMPA